jgi:hypothetical protein
VAYEKGETYLLQHIPCVCNKVITNLSPPSLYGTKSREGEIFATLEREESSTEIVRGLKVAVVMHTAIQVTDPAVV